MESSGVSLLSIKSTDDDLIVKSREVTTTTVIVETPDNANSVLSDNDEEASPRSASSRSSKRAHSNTSVTERSKFRSKLDCFPMYTATSVTSARDEPEANYFRPESTKTIQPIRHDSHDSSSSVLDSNPSVHSKAPLDSVLSNKELSPLFHIKMISQLELSRLINWHYSRPLPDCEVLFPWLHGIHHSNQNQRDFLNSLANFTSVNKNNFDFFQNSTRIPTSYRNLMPIRSALGNSSAVIKGSVAAEEILCSLDISKQDLLIMLNNLLKEIRLDESHTKEEFDSTLAVLHKDCLKTSLLPLFKNLDPQRGISLRNFHIQVSKMAQISDFVVYCFNENHLSKEEKVTCLCGSIARILYYAQVKHSIDHPELVDSLFSTLILDCNDPNFYRKHPNLLAFDRYSDIKEDTNALPELKTLENWDNNYLLREKFEISKMSSATPLTENVWCGNSTDFEVLKVNGFDPKNSYNPGKIPQYVDSNNSTVTNPKLEMAEDETYLLSPAKANWKMFINCCENSAFPDVDTLGFLLHKSGPLQEEVHLSFLPSGSIGLGDCTETDLISLINTCKVLYTRSSKESPALVHCSDGYTESSLLAISYLIYATGKRLAEVVLDLHITLGRPFFLFPTDVLLLSKLEDILIHYSPSTMREKFDPKSLESLSDAIIYNNLFLPKSGNWFTTVSGSMPSRILPHLYLGSLTHANSFELLSKLGIKRIVSVGEVLDCMDAQLHLRVKNINSNISIFTDFNEGSPINQLMSITNIQDDGIDMLTHSLPDILSFIDEGYKAGENILVHCRVGVSRSATVCIAEVMKRLNINLIRAYIYVRVRRLNIIIQPNLRFMYELFKWEEAERIKGFKRGKTALSSESSVSSQDSAVSIGNILSAEQLGMPSVTVNERVSDSELSDDESDPSERSGRWLRDVDWHVLCREIDKLNKAYIRS